MSDKKGELRNDLMKLSKRDIFLFLSVPLASTIVILSGFINSVQAQVIYGFNSNESWTTNPYYGSRGTFFADVTGDGKADAIVVNNDRVTVRRSNGSTFLANESWTTNPYYGSFGTFFADVTGDGKADAIVVNNDRVTVRRSNGLTFLANESWTTNPYYGSLGTFFADVTGDGKADAIVVNNDKVTVRRAR